MNKKKTTVIKYPKIKKYLVDAYTRYFNMVVRQTGEMPIQKDFAEYLGLEPTSLGQWITGKRPIPDQWQHVIAQKLGPGIYDACDTPRRMPETGELRTIIDDWYELEPEQQRELIEDMKSFVAQNRERRAQEPAPKTEPAQG